MAKKKCATLREWMSTFGSTDRAATVDKAVAEMKCTRGSAVRMYGELFGDASLPESDASGISEKDLRAKHDALFIVREAAKKLEKGKFFPEAEFRESMCRLDPSKFRSKADGQEFEKYKGRTQGKTYWGHPESIKRMKDDGVLL